MGSRDHFLKRVSEEDLPKLLDVLKKNLPDSIVPYHWILTHLAWRKKIENLKVDILSPDWTDGSVVCIADKLADDNKIYGVLYAKEDKIDSLARALIHTDLIDWHRLKQFSSVLERHVTAVAEILKIKGFKHTGDAIENFCHLHYMSVEEAANLPLPELPANVRVAPLDQSHLQIVCDNWRHYDYQYRPVVAKEIELNPTIGVFVKNEQGEEELASMVLQSEYGAAGLLQTVPKFKRMGYATIAMAHITRALGQKGFMPYGTVLTWNEGSSKLLQKLGFKILGISTWVYLKKPDEKSDH
ncbi:uncharacterized protein LOC132194716 [Neocloeon triangulifer]|uniref:uncharacterized protein LOC132194716 n=1 Tax=Neocloeon triangulifer TaxID=2078957 RepID=UPI00286EFF64|nr:uncharacterized protein LOC132194716 [Neocloeon triangulifer]